MTARVVVVVDRLVVHGLDRAAAAVVEEQLRDALSAEAATWAGAIGRPPAAGHRPSPSIVTVTATGRSTLGVQVAEAVAATVRGTTGRRGSPAVAGEGPS